jgi:hypothetical protein
MSEKFTFTYNYDNIDTIVSMPLAILIGAAVAVATFWVVFFWRKAFPNGAHLKDFAYVGQMALTVAPILIFVLLLAGVLTDNPTAIAKHTRDVFTSEITAEGYKITGEQVDELRNYMYVSVRDDNDALVTLYYGVTDLSDGTKILAVFTPNMPGSTKEVTVQTVSENEDVKNILNKWYDS